jgi:hypothetical protein
MYYNSTTSEVTSVAPWGNHYYDDDLKAELFADWTEVADDYIPDVPLADAKLAKLSSLKDSAAEAYVAGFSSSATGASLWYDSDTSTQSQITSASLLALASATTFNTMYPSGLTIRAKASSTADDSTKVQCAHTASQIITLSTDMQAMLAKVKAKLWGYQETIYSATTVSEVDAVSWV